MLSVSDVLTYIDKTVTISIFIIVLFIDSHRIKLIVLLFDFVPYF